MNKLFQKAMPNIVFTFYIYDVMCSILKSSYQHRNRFDVTFEDICGFTRLGRYKHLTAKTHYAELTLSVCQNVTTEPRFAKENDITTEGVKG